MIYRGDIYLAKLEGTEHEQNGLRPVVIIQNNKASRYGDTLTSVPLTTSEATLPTHTIIKCGGVNRLKEDSVSKAEHITTIDKSRIRGYLGCCTKEELDRIEETIKIHCGLMEG